MPFSSHIAELRSRLRIVAASFFVIFLLLVFFPANPAQSVSNPSQYLSLSFLANTLIASFLGRVVHDLLPLCSSGAAPPCWTLIAANGIGEGMEVYFVAALLLTLALDMPVIAYEMYRFIDPALKENERRMIYPFVIATSSLFIAGLLLGYFVLAKFLIVALAPFFFAGQISLSVDAAAFYYIVFLIIGATGASFTSPVFVYSLIRLRILNADFFSKNRVPIWFVTWVVTGLFLTPDGGPLLDLVIFVPIIVMIELAVALGRRSVRGETTSAPKPVTGIVCPSCGKGYLLPVLFCDRCGKSMA
jgi:sec-independent protein translocase protein TatC